jgi:hypothetical protein
MHRFTRADVESALAGYRELTNDHSATLERVDMATTTIYRVQKSQHLHGFQAWGAAAAYNAIKRFCDGYRIGAGMPPEAELSAWRCGPKRGRGL